MKNMSCCLPRSPYDYKTHYACFDCRKSFKRVLLRDIEKRVKSMVQVKGECPNCKQKIIANIESRLKSEMKCPDCKALINIQTSQKISEIKAKCPDCKGMVFNMGMDFEAPKQTDLKAWKHMKNLSRIKRFQPTSCDRVGYVPKTKESLIAYLEEKINCYHKNNNKEPSIYWASKEAEAKQRVEELKGQKSNSYSRRRYPLKAIR